MAIGRIRERIRALAQTGLGILLGLSASTLSAAETTVAVASNFAAPMKEIVAAFEAASGHEVRLVLGSSGRFHAQILNGAPFDVLFSADQSTPVALEEAGAVVPGSRFTYAVGRLVLWSSRADLVESGPEALKQGGFNKLALANPRLAPYGAAAREVLRHLDLLEASNARLIQGESIAQTYQFVATGNADLGFVALSQVLSHVRQPQAIQGREFKSGSGWLVPETMHSPIRQDAVLLRRAEDNQAARALLEFLRGPAARVVMEIYGYEAAQ